MSFTIVLPSYGPSPWLKEAVESVLKQKTNNWHLLIADDGLDETAQDWLRKKISELQDNRIQWSKRPRNLGLFANLNHAIAEAQTDWIVLLCSDDALRPSAIEKLEDLQRNWPKAELILSSFESINSDGSLRPDDSSRHHDQLMTKNGLVKPEEMIPALLRLGSLNGNLTGMAFSKRHWQNVGPFREDWRHAADWEWLIRASETKALLLNREPIAVVRTHGAQLSVQNRNSGHEIVEVGAVVECLLGHEMVRQEPRRWEWAGHIMQFQLWNLIKGAGQGNWGQWGTGFKAIHKSAGVRQTCRSLLSWLPSRWETRANQRSS